MRRQYAIIVVVFVIVIIIHYSSPTITRGHSSNKNNYARVGCGQRDGLRSSPSVQNYYTRKRSSSVENCIRTHSTGSHKNRSRTPSPRGMYAVSIYSKQENNTGV